MNDIYTYEDLLTKYGAPVSAFHEAGSYSGRWAARTSRGWVIDYFGSCSGCDALQGCHDEVEQRQLAEGLLLVVYTQQQALDYLEEDAAWEDDARELVEFIKANPINN